MNSGDLERLMNDALDGVATPEEEAWLRARLEHDSAAREQYRQLEEVFAVLGKVPLETPPPELRAGVSRVISVGHGALGPRRRGQGWLDSLRTFVARRPAVGAAYAFAAGAVTVGIAALAFVRGPGAGLPVSGTMTNPPEALGTVIESKENQVGEARFQIRTRHVSQGIGLELDVRSTGPTETLLEYDPSAVDARTLRWSPPADVQASSGWARLSATANARFLVLLEGHGDRRAEIHVTLRAGDRSAEEVFRMAPDRSVP
jgi:hypothetical protein